MEHTQENKKKKKGFDILFFPFRLEGFLQYIPKRFLLVKRRCGFLAAPLAVAFPPNHQSVGFFFFFLHNNQVQQRTKFFFLFTR
jgi:hypothetical protein